MPTGADVIVERAAAAGISVCFANPGTTEIGFVDALERHPSVRTVLGLFEGVCTGAADGFARVAGVPAMTLLHLGAGFANGMANLHNARRAGCGVLNVVGDHPAEHLRHDSPLTSDIEGMARTVSDWVRTTTAATLAADTAEAIAAAGRGLVATLIVPMDVQSDPALPGTPPAAAAPPSPEVDLDRVARALARPDAVLLLGGRAVHRSSLLLARRVEQATGCRVLTHTFNARHDRGRGIPSFTALPYFPELAAEALASTSVLVTVGAGEPAGTFAVPGVACPLTPAAAERVDLSAHDPATVLSMLADHLGAPAADVPDLPPATAATDDGVVSARTLGTIVAATLPEGSVVVEEAATNGIGYARAAAAAPPHAALGLTGGAIGMGLPVAVGAALATDRPVVALQADGSAMYTNQALWTMAREGLDVTVVLLSNRRYAILQAEAQRAGIAELGPVTRSLTELTDPTIDWVGLARSLGVPGERCATNAELARALERSLTTPGPTLLQVDL